MLNFANVNKAICVFGVLAVMRTPVNFRHPCSIERMRKRGVTESKCWKCQKYHHGQIPKNFKSSFSISEQ